MGHVRLGTLARTKKWRAVIESLRGGDSVQEIARAAAEASERDLARASSDPVFQFVSSLLVELPHIARTPEFHDYLDGLGISGAALQSVPDLLAGLDAAILERSFQETGTTDAGGLARAAILESLSVQLRDRLPTLFEPSPAEIRKALASFSSGQGFALLARDFFSRLTYRSLDYYLSRELANHIGAGQRFANDAERTAFQRELAQHSFEASRIIEEYAGGWYGKTVWQKQALDQTAINKFTSYSFKKMRDELGRRRAEA